MGSKSKKRLSPSVRDAVPRQALATINESASSHSILGALIVSTSALCATRGAVSGTQQGLHQIVKVYFCELHSQVEWRSITTNFGQVDRRDPRSSRNLRS
ncbi:hypothetical protein BE61_78680 [Bradyrhizobium elkanii USDA 61]|jgi:hypothetical protein|nr:hypothetical protein BE61_78680 [Bradyrhizobium elkanii USDA 61]GEC56696.1 hypothetical protein BEL01nite_57390 [Bradyrhizobium elkanii]